MLCYVMLQYYTLNL